MTTRRTDSEDFADIQRLLRLKRYEQPGPSFADQTLAEFHRRQSADLLHRPLWRIAMDRFGSWVGGDDPVPRRAFGTVGFAAATALILAGLLFGDRILQMGPQVVKSFASADTQNAAPTRAIQLEATPVAHGGSRHGASSGSGQFAELLNPDLDFVYMLSSGQVERSRLGDAASGSASARGSSAVPALGATAQTRSAPRYILDSRLVSYEPTRF